MSKINNQKISTVEANPVDFFFKHMPVSAVFYAYETSVKFYFLLPRK